MAFIYSSDFHKIIPEKKVLKSDEIFLTSATARKGILQIIQNETEALQNKKGNTNTKQKHQTLEKSTKMLNINYK